MSGWGDWLEKGKALAATIDQQINESVGVVETTQPAANAVGRQPNEAADLNDAWNHDFDDDVVLDEDDNNNNGWNNEEEEEEIVMENQTETTTTTTTAAAADSKEELFSSPLPQVKASPVAFSVAADKGSFQPTPVMEAVAPLAETESATTITDDHFAAPQAASSALKDNDDNEDELIMTGQNEGWDDDNDLHIDGHDADNQPQITAGTSTRVHQSPPARPEHGHLSTGESQSKAHLQDQHSTPTMVTVPPPLPSLETQRYLPSPSEPRSSVVVVEPPDDDDDDDDDIAVESFPAGACKETMTERPKQADDADKEKVVVSSRKETHSGQEQPVVVGQQVAAKDDSTMMIEASTVPPVVAEEEIQQPQDEQPVRTKMTEALRQQEDNNTGAADTSMLSQSQADHLDERVLRLQEESQMAVALLESQLEDLQMQLGQREDQLSSKAEQLSAMQEMFEAEKEELKRKVADTKEEAKKRILRAKERVEAMEKRLANAHKSADEAGAQGEIIAALREEGEKLAHKQSEMEKAVRSAKGETRDLREQLEAETEAKNMALAKIASLEADLKRTKDDLLAARKGESQVVKLDAELLSLKEECEKKASTNLSLEQQVKEMKTENRELRTEVERARRGAELENEAESKKLKKEHNDLLSDLENKLRTSEREANLREDALRHEVAEIRKRWQDAVRRADALSMDVQQSTAPLLRQLESLERQSRARAATWAELEAKLRSDLEDSVIENEKLVKERNDFKSTANRLQRQMKDRDDELASSRSKLDDQSVKIKQLETKLTTAESERQKMKEKYEEIEKVANEGVSKVRSDMMQTVVESEERYRAQIETAEKELRTERDIRSQLERQVEQLLDNSGMVQLPPSSGEPKIQEEKQMKLRSTQGQAEILASTLSGLDSDDDGESDTDEEESSPRMGVSSFAAMEELNQRLKGTTVELGALRQRLAEAEASRESLMEELIQTRQAKEKLPLFEAKVKELTEENQEKELEIMGLRQDIQEVGQLYRSQLNSLLEEKASAMAGDLNGGHKNPGAIDEQPADEQPYADAEEN